MTETRDCRVMPILALIGKYFDALYHGDAEAFGEIFHPEARLFCATGEQKVVMGLPEYLHLVRGRPAPASNGQRREDAILAIETPTPTTAHVRVSELFLPKRFIDELTLLHLDGEWRIVSKVWHFVLENDHA